MQGAWQLPLFKCWPPDPTTLQFLTCVIVPLLPPSSIIILAGDTDAEQSDASLIRVVLSLMGMHKELLESGKGGLKVRSV